MDTGKTGRMIAKLRKQAGFTQSALAEKLGISDKAVSKWERGIACPDVSQWGALSVLLDTDIESLIYGSEGESEWKGVLLLDPRVPAETIVFDKPLIHYLLSMFLLAGVSHIQIVGECCAIDYPGIRVERLSAWEQINQRFTGNAMVVYGNCFLYGPNLTRHIRRAMSRTDSVTVFAAERRRGDYPLTVDQDRKAVWTPEPTAKRYFAERLAFVPGAPRRGIPKAFEEVLRQPGINAETLARGMAAFDVSSYAAAHEMAGFVRLMQDMTAERIGCIEEILLRRGLTAYEDVQTRCDRETARYLEGLFQ